MYTIYTTKSIYSAVKFIILHAGATVKEKGRTENDQRYWRRELRCFLECKRSILIN